MLVKDFVNTMNIDDYFNVNKTVGDLYFNFNNTNDCCVNLIGNPKYRSEDFNKNQLNKILESKVSSYEITNWKFETEKNGNVSIYFTVLK